MGLDSARLFSHVKGVSDLRDKVFLYRNREFLNEKQLSHFSEQISHYNLHIIKKLERLVINPLGYDPPKFSYSRDIVLSKTRRDSAVVRRTVPSSLLTSF